jgi:oligoendopeptidase F
MAGAASTFDEHRRFFAGAINAISGTRLTLNKRRSIPHFLHPSLQSARLQQASLEAMMQAIDTSLPQIRDIFRYRSKACGISDPGYADLRAPLPIANKPTLDWEDGVRLISSAFHTAYPALADFFDSMIQHRWIDWSPRAAKRPGGFCTSSTYIRQSRIFMTYRNTLSDILTLAHEAGHAWHSRLLADARPFAASYPMTLAETASTFAERILTKGILADTSADPTVQLLLLDAEIEHTLAFLLDLPVRFRFENAVYQKRASAELSASELCDLMASTQREVFGDSLADNGTDPWFWASKLHFYINEVQFYNYPYTFGFLLSTVMIQHLNQHGNAFLDDYERFMRLSGSASCEDLARDVMQADMADPAFWNSAISSLQQPFTAYKSLLEAR